MGRPDLPLPHVVLALTAACALGAGGCRVYDPALVSGMDAGADAGTCASRRAPPRPTIADTADGPDVAFGLREVVLDQGAEWENVGLDVDGYCTVPGNLVSECVPGGPIQRDGLDGIDNVFGSDLYPLVASAVPGLEETARAAQDEGWGLPVLYVRGWNGTPDDPHIDVAIMGAVFSSSVDGATPDVPPDVVIHSPNRGDQELTSGGPVPGPEWDGNDWVWVRDDAFVASDFEQPLLRDDNAYVAGGRLVARLPSRVDIVFPTDTVGVLVRVTDATAIAVINPDGITLDEVMVAGRWSNTDLLSTAENVGICRGGGQYEILAAQLGRIADVRSMPPAPGDTSAPCNAVSLGVTFTGTRMRVVSDELTPGLPLVDVCSIDGGVPLDGSEPDAGAPDAGAPDAPDAGALDAGTDDAGSVAVDAPAPLDPCVPGAAVCDDFESGPGGRVPPWDWNNGTPTRSAAQVFRGASSGRFAIMAGGATVEEDIGLNLPAGTTELYARFWAYVPSTATPQDLAIAVLGDGVAPAFQNHSIVVGSTGWGLFNEVAGAYSGPVAFPSDAWTCVVFHAVLGTPGRLELSVAGATPIVAVGTTAFGADAALFGLGITYAGATQTSPFEVFLDDVTVTTGGSPLACP